MSVHGHPEYGPWKAMMQRCLHPGNKRYARYGGRGIKVSERWQDFYNFLRDMGPRPPNHDIHRINKDEDYELGNCYWISKKRHGRVAGVELMRERRYAR